MENVKTIERLFQKKAVGHGPADGFVELDKLTAGLQPSDLIIVAGRPSMGKTAFCLNIAQHVAFSDGGNAPVGIFSMEMSKEQLVMRLLSSESEVEFSKLADRRTLQWRVAEARTGSRYTLQGPYIYRRTPLPWQYLTCGPGEEAEERARCGSSHHRLPASL